MGSALLILSIVLFSLYKRQQHKKREYASQLQLKEAQTYSKLQGQRLQISRDLHDNIGSQLTFIISSVDNVKYAFDINNPKLDAKLSGISNFAKETIIELRDTIWAMNKSEISFEDLESRIHNFVEKAKESTSNILFTISISESLKNTTFSSVTGINVYRIIQEAVNNSIKYSNAKTISIAIKADVNAINFHITDDGIGFVKEEVTFGNGISNIQKRVNDLGGIFDLQSSNEKGTLLYFQIPN